MGFNFFFKYFKNLLLFDFVFMNRSSLMQAIEQSGPAIGVTARSMQWSKAQSSKNIMY